MKLSPAQQKKVEENMKLVGKVIKDKVHGFNQSGIYSYEDLTQIGYIGLCKAVYTDKGGCFSTYAYRLIWNEICDALIKANSQYSREISLEGANGTDPESFLQRFALSQSEPRQLYKMVSRRCATHRTDTAAGKLEQR